MEREGRSIPGIDFDATRDLLMPALGHPAVRMLALGHRAVLRIPALDGDGEAAYLRSRTRIREVLETKR